MFTRILILLFFLNVNYCFSQTCLDDILNDKLYSNSNSIVNGRQWKNEKKYRGTPLLIENQWPKADILYNGSRFSGQLMNYDVYKNEIIIYHPVKGEEKYVVINNDNLSSFSFTDSIANKSRVFEYTELQGFKGKTLYENAVTGKVLLFIKPIKNIEFGSGRRSKGQFTDYYEYYLNPGNGFVKVGSASQLIRLFSEHGSELKDYIRRKRIKINSQHPENIIDVINFINRLN